MKLHFLILILSFIALENKCLSQSADSRCDSTDILHFDINLSLKNLPSKSISGLTRITFKSKVSELAYARFDLEALQVDSVKLAQSHLPFSQNGNSLLVSFIEPLKIYDTIVIEIFYKGQPVSDKRWGGFYFSGQYAFNLGVGFDAKPHNFGRCWFPCYDNFIERASVSTHITTDSGFMAVCGGLPLPEITNPDGSITWHWNLSQAIPSYLVSVAVGKYASVNLNNILPINTYLVAEPRDTQNFKLSFTNLKKAYETFVQLFGPYRFDRVGFVGVPFNAGAMEHATNIAYPLYAVNGALDNETLMAHELSHHWWGDLATCRTSEDMWINEGWASYCEALFLEAAYGKQAYNNDILSKNMYVQRYAHIRDSGFRAVSGVPHSFTYGDHVYKKGALMLHNLRTYMGDSAFFNACRAFLSKYTFNDVSTEDLRNTFSDYADSTLIANFIDQWIKKAGTPAFKVNQIQKKQNGSNWDVTVVVQQLLRTPGQMYTQVPLELTLGNGIYKQSAIIYFKGNSSSNTEDFNFTLSFEPQLAMLNARQTMAYGVTQQTDTIISTGLKQYPNAFITLTNLTIPAASKNITHLEHIWARADQNYCIIPGLFVSNYRHWKVSGIWADGFKAEAFINFDGSRPSNGGFLDHTLIGQTEDSLVLVYRPDANANWIIVHDTLALKQTGPSTTDKIGRFWVKNLKQGEYAMACFNKNLAKIRKTESKAHHNRFVIMPNPANNMIHIKAGNDIISRERITIYNNEGKLMMDAAWPEDDMMQISQLPAGNFYVMLHCTGYSELHKLMIAR
ncbi:MAG: M1 family aminopeptidase [Bacteroidota bacterium]|jgi:aminopeptidase N